MRKEAITPLFCNTVSHTETNRIYIYLAFLCGFISRGIMNTNLDPLRPDMPG